jgi:hypothetical protein
MVLWVPLHRYLDGCSPMLTCYEGQDLPLADIARPPSKAAVAPRNKGGVCCVAYTQVRMPDGTSMEPFPRREVRRIAGNVPRVAACAVVSKCVSVL